ncbi:MAG: EVE domain-containing protein [Methanomassiliicoccales archaeon]|nr:EVE domain-containing protein [Methanomassiliicoccales archaeon]
MAKWLFKEEPSHYSFEHLEMDGTATWDGVRNNTALRNLSLVKKGDEIIYYHTGDEKAAAGLAESTSDAFRDDEGFWVVRIRPVNKFRKSVSLRLIKDAGQFSASPLVRLPRVSVLPVDDKLWNFIIEHSK